MFHIDLQIRHPSLIHVYQYSLLKCVDLPITAQFRAVVEWLSSWLAEQEVQGSIPGLAT